MTKVSTNAPKVEAKKSSLTTSKPVVSKGKVMKKKADNPVMKKEFLTH